MAGLFTVSVLPQSVSFRPLLLSSANFGNCQAARGWKRCIAHFLASLGSFEMLRYRCGWAFLKRIYPAVNHRRHPCKDRF